MKLSRFSFFSLSLPLLSFSIVQPPPHLLRPQVWYRPRREVLTYVWNTYDKWRVNGLVDTVPLDEEMVEICLEEFVMSDYGETMFGCHSKPASVGITGKISLDYCEGPSVVLSLHGSFWHRRSTVLGRAAIWLNAKMPEISEVRTKLQMDLEDEDEIMDDMGVVISRIDKRSPDFNGDRATMERMGLDPDERGPFPPGTGGFRAGGSMILPS